jgi:DNA-binding NtrC family response regulator
MTKEILVIDDDQSMCELIREGLQRRGVHVEWCLDGEEGLALARRKEFLVIIVDLHLENMNGLDLCQRLTRDRPDTLVIVITAFGSMASAVGALRAGACDFINKPLDMAELNQVIERNVQHRALLREVKRLRCDALSAPCLGALAGKSSVMLSVYDMIRRVADTDTTVLLSGESGTGKELVARALHSESRRAAMPFVAINCAAVPASLLEAELFGHAQGAFTDAKGKRKGLFEQAEGGTLLLDEIGEMPLEMQPKLLRVLQERQVRPVGGNEMVPVNTRIVAATNRHLETEVEQQRFREDLFYRLNVVQISVPPLRTRGQDVLLLAQQFLHKFASKLSKGVTGFSCEAARKLLEYDWPGNVRQLENSIERAVTLTRFEQITVDDLPDRISRYEPTQGLSGDADSEHILTWEQLERRYIEYTLKASQGNKTQAASSLGVDRRTLYRKLERYASADNSHMLEVSPERRGDMGSDHAVLDSPSDEPRASHG